MIIARIADLSRLARACFLRAKRVATAISLSANAQFSESVKYAKILEGRHLASEPEYKELPPFCGLKAWGAMLSFDLRKSSQRAVRIGPHDTYVTMHTYLPTMLDLVNKAGGIVVGLRGDGAIACFGIVNTMDESAPVTPAQGAKAITIACDCGDAMIHAIDEVVNPVIENGGVEGGLVLGVGIDVGDFVATNIGLGDATELTAYGNCVNQACKFHDANGKVVVSYKAQQLFPTSKGGRTAFAKNPTNDGYVLRYPPDYKTLA